MAVVREKEVITRLLRKYRDYPWLWNSTHEFHNNKKKRSEAMTELLKFYKMYEPDATAHDMKRRIENMRSAYRRTRNLVLKARAKGQLYTPHLWYYDELTFLHEGIDQFTEFEQLEPDEENLEEEEEEEEAECKDDIFEDVSAKSRRLSSPPSKKRMSNYVFVSDQIGSSNQGETSISSLQEHNNLNASSSDFYGRTVASQLEELQPFQRYIAEKLISEVVFYARLEKLCPETSISLNND